MPNEQGQTQFDKAATADSSERHIDLLDLLLLLAQNARLLVLGPILAGGLALGFTLLISPTFTGTTRIIPPQQHQGAAAMLASQLGALAGIAGMTGLNIKNPADMYVALIKSRSVADALVIRFNLLSVYGEKYREDARKKLASATTARAGKDGLITIEVDDKDAKRAADLANAYVEELLRLTGSLTITEAQQRRLFFEKQLHQTQAELRRAELALAQTGAGENLIKSAPQTVVESIARLKAQLTAQQIRISTMRAYLTDASPELQLAQRELDSLRLQLNQVEKSQPTRGVQVSDYLNRFRDFKYQETLFELMSKQYELARLDEAREGAYVQVVDPAIVPERHSKPRTALITIATSLVSAVLLLIFVFLRQAWREIGVDPRGSRKLSEITALLRRGTR